jgi:hypothetical protein
MAPSMAALPGGVKSWVLAMLAAKRRLRVAPVPPQAADLTPPATAAINKVGRGEGTGALTEQRNIWCAAAGDWPTKRLPDNVRSLMKTRPSPSRTQKFG